MYKFSAIDDLFANKSVRKCGQSKGIKHKSTILKLLTQKQLSESNIRQGRGGKDQEVDRRNSSN